MATFVIVHGAFGGGWEWTPVARRLRRMGHEVFTPTLTGMGERAHLYGDRPVGLSTHIEDVAAAIECEGLRDVLLCGASYGGMAATGAADRLAERVALLVYIDALVPRDGQCGLDLLPEGFGDAVRAGVAEHGAGWRVPMPPALLEALLPPDSLPEDERARVAARLSEQPAASFIEPLHLTGAVDRVRRAFIRCTGGELGGAYGEDPIEAMAVRARTEGWVYREIAAPHDPQLFDPDGTAALLDELSALVTIGGAGPGGAEPRT